MHDSRKYRLLTDLCGCGVPVLHSKFQLHGGKECHNVNTRHVLIVLTAYPGINRALGEVSGDAPRV